MDRLLIDIGASSIKSVIQKNNVPDVKTQYITESFSTKYGDKFSSKLIVDEFINHVKRQYDIYAFQEIWICCEMHNFTLFDTKTNKYSDFHSWRYASDETESIKSKLLQFQNQHHKISGQSLIQGIPIINFSRSYETNSKQRVLTLPEVIVHRLGKSSNKIHDTMAASSGFLDIKNKEWMLKDLKYLYPDVDFITPEVFKDEEIPILGSIAIQNNTINIFGGFGDLQAAMFGTGIMSDEICINLGTGSQIVAISDNKPSYSDKFDTKPYFGNYIKAITHIPAGRSFNYINSEICKDNNFWPNLYKVNMTLPINYRPDFNLNIFKSNWRYDKNAKNKILNSFKNNANFYEILLKTFCEEYVAAIDILDPDHKYKNIVLSGGKLKDIEYVKNFFKDLENYSVKVNKNNLLLDETLIGLNKLSSIYN